LSKCGIGRTALPGGIDREDALELVLDPPAELQRLHDTEGFGQPSHIGREPEVAFDTTTCEANRALTRAHAALKRASPFNICWMRAEPITGTREFPGRIDSDAGSLHPQVGRQHRAREIV